MKTKLDRDRKLLNNAIGDMRTGTLPKNAEKLRKVILDIKRNNPTLAIEEWARQFPEPYGSNITLYQKKDDLHRKLFKLAKIEWFTKKDPTMYVFNEVDKITRLTRQEIYKQLIMDPSLVDLHVHANSFRYVMDPKDIVSIIEERSPSLKQRWKKVNEDTKEGHVRNAISLTTLEPDPELCRLYFPTGYRSVQRGFFNDDVPFKNDRRFSKLNKNGQKRFQNNYAFNRIGTRLIVATIHAAHEQWLQNGKSFTNMEFVDMPKHIEEDNALRKAMDIPEGYIVDDPRFGEGIVENVEDSGELQVFFPDDQTTRLVKITDITLDEKLEDLIGQVGQQTAKMNTMAVQLEALANHSGPVESQRNFILRSLLAAAYPIRIVARIRLQSPVYSKR